MQASSLDPKRAKQASKETQDAMFAKLDSYIHLLHAMGLVPWENYQEIPPQCLYNMDELGNIMTMHHKKAKTDEAKEMHKTPEGDGHMPWHITVCLMTHADGEYIGLFWLIVVFIVVVHGKLVDIVCEKVSWLIVERGRAKSNLVSFHCR